MSAPSVDALKLGRDGHLWFGPPQRAGLRQVLPVVEVDAETGHTYRSAGPGMGVIEYAPADCTCPPCTARRGAPQPTHETGRQG